MNIISIDTSRKFCSISISLDDNIKESINSTIPLSHSSELALNLKKLINKHNILIKDLDFIIVNIGPGSFTGLRIGISFAKGLCLSNNIPLIPINSFDVINDKVNCSENLFYYAIYSHKDYVYGKKYDNNRENEPKLINLKDKLNSPIYICGLGEIVGRYNNDIINIDFDSSDLIRLGVKQFKNKDFPALNSILPMYIDYNDVI